ncbi:MAG: hypothetical protein HYV26_12075, partial [Candidatus Hydrogenedentes bacterium]|nr:hypothetical protein [Candidatus Hydrogenedentota bacterium]
MARSPDRATRLTEGLLPYSTPTRTVPPWRTQKLTVAPSAVRVQVMPPGASQPSTAAAGYQAPAP